MALCIHGDVCKAYVNEKKAILSDYCPRGCKYFKPISACPKCRKNVISEYKFCPCCGYDLRRK